MAATSETLYAIFKGFPVFASPTPRATPIGAAVNSEFIVRRRQDVTFVCPVPGCGSTFTSSLSLKQHILCHDKGKSFVCKWPGCLKVFERHHNYKKHEQLHANYRPFTCEECKKQFMRMDGLNRHLRSKAGAECQPKSRLTGVPCTFQVRRSGVGEYRYIASVPMGMSPTFPIDRADPAELMNELSLPRSSWFNQAAEKLGEEAQRTLRSGKSMRPWASGGVATKREVPVA
ncbi:hypothetical protein B0H14DRAFT_1144364 [Mycena olivaceomarginata]|nr:hypothetical protein B0H14DRAFT_1144364 [Mycena olivaceomarginata]